MLNVVCGCVGVDDYHLVSIGCILSRHFAEVFIDFEWFHKVNLQVCGM